MRTRKSTRPAKSYRNGIKLSGVFETVAAITDDATLAKFRLRANNRWIDGGRNRSTVQGFYGCGREDISRAEPFVMNADEPLVLHGQDTGASTLEFLLHALAGCLTTTLVYHAAVRGIEIDAIESNLEGNIDLRGFLGISKSVPKGYQDIRVRMRVTSDADPELLRELAEFSPIYDVVSKSLPVEVLVVTV